MTAMGAADTFDRSNNFLVAERRSTADAIPAQEKLGRDLRVDIVPKQVPCQRGNRVITGTFGNAVANQPAPMLAGMTGTRHVASDQGHKPRRQRCQSDVIRMVRYFPFGATARSMQRRRHHDQPAITAQVKARCQADPVMQDTAGMGEVDVPAATAAFRFNGRRQGAETSLQVRKAVIAAVSRIDVKHNQT